MYEEVSILIMCSFTLNKSSRGIVKNCDVNDFRNILQLLKILLTDKIWPKPLSFIEIHQQSCTPDCSLSSALLLTEIDSPGAEIS